MGCCWRSKGCADGLLDSGISAGRRRVSCLARPLGAGKSLLLRALVDLDPNEGRVTLDGQDRRAMPAGSWRRAIAYLPAESGWWASDVASHMDDRERAQALLAKVRWPRRPWGWESPAVHRREAKTGPRSSPDPRSERTAGWTSRPRPWTRRQRPPSKRCSKAFWRRQEHPSGHPQCGPGRTPGGPKPDHRQGSSAEEKR